MKIFVAQNPTLLRELMEGLTQAIGGCSQLVHQMGGDARWLMIRDALELTKEGLMSMTSFEGINMGAKN